MLRLGEWQLVQSGVYMKTLEGGSNYGDIRVERAQVQVDFMGIMQHALPMSAPNDLSRAAQKGFSKEERIPSDGSHSCRV